MYNDSIDTLLLRHYGRSAPAPVDLEAHLLASVRLVALSTAGLGALSLGLEGLRLVEAALIGQDTTKPAYT